MKLLRHWFTFEGSVARRAYLVHGAALMAVKYLTDAALIWFLAGARWLPSDYITTGSSFEHSKLAGAPAMLPLILSAWTVPFLWVGLTLTTRRALDAKVSPWFALCFVVPLVNYFAMLLLCVLPTADEPATEPAPMAYRGKRQGQYAALAAGTATGVLLVVIGVMALRSYGAALFVGTPFIMGAITAYVFNRWYPATSGETLEMVMWTLGAVGAALLVFAIEGALCLIMALPLAVATAWLGSKFGRFVAQQEAGATAHIVMVVLLAPLATPLIDARSAVRTREVRSAVEITAGPDIVWRNVVEFPRIDGPRELLFRAGVAYPIGARIDGQGVGAIRYCEFSTGSFVEPITRWEPGRRLSFDVTRQPAPMRELSPYGIQPPHLDGYFRAVRGEFRLIALPDGGTRLEGSTWYDLTIHPAPYFALIADFVVGRIHKRVLSHIRAIGEAERVLAASTSP